MHRLLIRLVNSFLIVTILIGVPAITSLRLGSLRISSDTQARFLILGGLTLATALNVTGALFGPWGRRERSACWQWAAILLGLLLIESLYFQGVINFHWLKNALLWVRGWTAGN